MAKIIYGSEIAKEIKAGIQQKITTLQTNGKRIPKLVVILVGDNQASQSYVKGKKKACLEVGMKNETILLEDSVSEEELLEKIGILNEDATVDGILVQLPLPKHIDEQKVLLRIDPKKDVDGFHPYNLGRMMLQQDTFISCTPKGIMRMLKYMGFDDLSGMKAVVIGRSNIVGKPVAQLLMNKNATVIVCHSKTKEIEKITSQGDIVIASIGKAKHIKANWIKQGAIVIDVGINRDENNKMCGDVDFEEVVKKASYITPVPKGVGPMTIAMLLENTLESYNKRENNKQQ